MGKNTVRIQLIGKWAPPHKRGDIIEVPKRPALHMLIRMWAREVSK
jgi:hypothetical protein